MKIRKLPTTIATLMITATFGLVSMGSAQAIPHNCYSSYNTCTRGGGDADQCHAVFIECLEGQGTGR
jgi:hypothetical protein